MPRQPRCYNPGIPRHVLICCFDRQPVFFRRRGYQNYLDYSMTEKEAFNRQTINAITGDDDADGNVLFATCKADAGIFSLGFRWQFGKE